MDESAEPDLERRMALRSSFLLLTLAGVVSALLRGPAIGIESLVRCPDRPLPWLYYRAAEIRGY